VSDTPAANVGVLLATLFPDAQFFDGWGENAKRMAVHKVGLSLQDIKIIDYLEHQDDNKMKWPTVYETLGIAKSHFSAAMKRPRLQAAIEAIGWEIVKGTRPNYFRRAVATEPVTASGTENATNDQVVDGHDEQEDGDASEIATELSKVASVSKASDGSQGAKWGSSDGKSEYTSRSSRPQSGTSQTARMGQKSSRNLRRRH
jgi:hypothetical protein